MCLLGTWKGKKRTLKTQMVHEIDLEKLQAATGIVKDERRDGNPTWEERAPLGGADGF